MTKIAPEQETPRAEMQEVETKKSRTRRELNHVVSGLKPPYSSRARRVALYLGLLVAVLSVSSVVGQQFPTSFRVPFGSATEAVFEWGVDHLAWLYEPVAESLEDVLVSMQFMLVDLPAPLLALLLIGIAYARCGPLIAGLLTVALGFVISVGLWDETLQTLVLMVVAVVIAVILGILIGVAAQMNRRFEAFVLIALDAMQTFPVFAYLVPIVFIFGPGNTGALIVTIIWALPPVTRMTILGIKTVPSESIEAATSCGSTGWQILRNVQIPLARPSIMAGVNQTVMFAMSMAIVAAMIGAGGLGQSVWGSLTRLAFGQALEAGIALVLFAIVLDRVTGQGKKKHRTWTVLRLQNPGYDNRRRASRACEKSFSAAPQNHPDGSGVIRRNHLHFYGPSSAICELRDPTRVAQTFVCRSG
ncbi:ABC transporter permease [Arthrobacter sp. SD76]|uniref:ABC transporter permease n=1 Tax=Arthrobacter sp. SD76 TaxID=3415007 RepID=UPI003C733541